MSRDKDKTIRQLSLLAFLLSRKRPVTAREIHEQVEGYGQMSDETFTRRFHADRSDLERVGILIDVLQSSELSDTGESPLYFLPEENFRLPEVTFTAEEARLLGFVLAALEGRFAYSRPLRMALTALLGGERNQLSDELERLPIVIEPDVDALMAGSRLARLEEAVSRHKTVCFSYISANGAKLDRTVDPYSLFQFRSHWYVVGRDHLRSDIRIFRVGRIEGPVRYATEKSRDFDVPSDYDPDQYRARPPWLLGPVTGEAIVRVGEDRAWLVKRLQPHVIWLGDDSRGASLFRFPFADKKVLLSWLVSIGGKETALDPPSLRTELLDLLLAVQRAHSEPAEEPSELEARRRRKVETPPGDFPIAAERLARALNLLTYLVRPGQPSFVPWEAFKQDLGLSPQEVEEDVGVINLVNFGGGTYALTADVTPDGVNVIRDVMADTFARPCRLSPTMAKALLLALDLVGETLAAEASPEALDSLRCKVAALVPDSPGQVAIDEFPIPDSSVLRTLDKAICDRTVVEIEYFHPYRQELAIREIEPYLLFHCPQGWYLAAYCLRAQSQRTFKLERIRTARLTGKAFTPRPEIDLRLPRAGRAFSSDKVATWATLRFHPRWQSELEDRVGEYVVCKDGWLRVRIPYASEEWVVRETVQYLGDAVLEKPAHLRTKVSELAQTLADHYRSQPPASFEETL